MERENLIVTVTAAQGGDNGALSTLFDEYYNDVYYFALKTVKDNELACDITQDTFIEVINTLSVLQEPAAFVSWLKKIAYHQCTRFFKKKTDILVNEDDEGNTLFDALAEDRTEFIPDEALDQQVFRDTILAMLDELSEEQRSATMLYYYDELSVKQIAEIQGVSEGTVKSRLNYARKFIKNSVETYEKKNGVKLHCAGVLPLMLWLLAGQHKETMPVPAVKTAAQGIRAATGVALTLPKAAAATGLLAKLIALPLVVKVIVPVAAVLVIGLAVASVPQKPADPTETKAPTYSTQGSIPNQSSDPTQGSTVPTDVTVPSTGTTDPTATPLTETQPSTTAPTGTEPGLTEPTVTVPTTELGGETLYPETAVPPTTELTPTSPNTPPSSEYFVPENCTYETKDGIVYQSGQAMPSEVSHQDKLITPDYTYRYDFMLKGWTVQVRDKSKSAYEPLLSHIHSIAVNSLIYAFENCVNLTTPPEIPDTVISLSYAFSGCTSLEIAPKIPAATKDLSYAFLGCTALKEAPVLPDNSPALQSTFSGCTALTVAPEIPPSVRGLSSTFSGCTSLQKAPILPENIVSLSATFSGCTSITEPPVIPEGVTAMNGTFNGCTALKTVPIIPASVTNMRATFADCVLITTPPVIPGGVIDMGLTFCGCTSLLSAPVIPASVRLMAGTFLNCTSLIGEVEINATIPEDKDCGGQCGICRKGIACFNCWDCGFITDCFQGAIQPIVLTGSCSRLQDFPRTALNYFVTTKEKTGNEVFSHVPTDCTYITADGAILPSGTAMPVNFKLDDKLVVSDYTYRFSYNGWSVSVNDKTKAVYAPIPDYISGIPVRDLSYTFEGCSNMTQAPAIPKLTYSLCGTFMDCSSLTEVPAIPDLVKNMANTFAECTSLRELPHIGSSATDMSNCFNGCTALTSVPAIPESVMYMDFAFYGCVALETAPALPDSVTSLAGTFMNCAALRSASVLPENAYVIQQMFSGCSALEQAPAIPAGVTDMMRVFQNCINLTGTVEIHATPQSYAECFAGTIKPIILSGSSGNLKELAATGTSNNISVK